jgi:L-amino acid N-acyltransferase YncA
MWHAAFTPIEIDVQDDHVLTVRAATKADAAGIRALYEDLSAEDSYRRFFAAIKVTNALVRKWVERCRDDGLGLVAVVDDGDASSRVVADAGYVLQPNGNGEFALTVAADRRGWLGPYLLDVLLDAAAERGVRNLEADILTENRVMLSLVRRRGYVTDGDRDFLVVHVVIGTEGHGPVWPSKPHGRKLLVEKPGGRWDGRKRALHAGFDVLVCGVREGCPALQGLPCPLADEADAIVVAFAPGDSQGHKLWRAHERLHSSVPVVVTTPSPAGVAREAGCQLVSGRPSAALRSQLAEALGADCSTGRP